MILVYGTLCLDRVYRIARLPRPGEYVPIDDAELFLGGEAANTANALLQWGSEVKLFGNRLGSGENGRDLLRLLKEKSIPTDFLQADVGETPVCHIYVTPDGERTMFGLGFGEKDQNQDLSGLPVRAGGWFTADPNLGSLSREAARLAHEAGMRLYLMDFIRDTDCLPPYSFWQSSTDWVGTRGNTQRNVGFVHRMVERHGCFCILSDGPNGLIAGSPDHEVRAYPPYPCPELVDSTGAGDMFRAGMLFGLEAGWEIPQCLQFASAAGCLKCKWLGATTYVPTVDEIQAHIAKHKTVSRHYL